jgi:exopolyphosphatase/pppGpp-phosphohydrolase
MKLLIFDIGSNSIRTARLTERELGSPVISDKRVYTTRLAEGLAESRVLSDARMRQSLFVIRSIHHDLSRLGYQSFAYATSAVRDAENGAEFACSVENILGNGHVRILSGNEEAAFAQLGADPSGKRAIIDIGGGSTQIVLSHTRESWPIGCVRAKDLAPYNDLSRIIETLRPVLSGLLHLPHTDGDTDVSSCGPVLKKNKIIPLGVGGTISSLALLCDGKTEFCGWKGEKQIGFLDLCAVLQSLSNMGDTKRAAIPLLKDRHDVILHGGAILLFVMEHLQSSRIGATLSDGLDGYALHLYRSMKT